ncbi:hypothetical protein SDRG_00612 [Saprolegnia diclina VS20]|uniref:Uncharacterized protein n=1 Tax=Saprolegnia diclina (strain VS20) TaxID=1156394 RepID=T0S8W9_SAPDV|nr:hypothetical protein SDRG_00612 [Saprolegnia diclina VS20]EQC41748.1 hypothetical protein SDRG_00612 [Saprolegnia diclina VS20]|eukprot:XP_008604317.1 hypothetical protein SDRG_00612 [Saprolegnia diclina VS20]
MMPGGVAWWASVRNPSTSVGAEAALWRTHAIDVYQRQWANDVQIGLHDTISILNAFGWRQDLTITVISYVDRSTKSTTGVLSPTFNLDIYTAVVTNSTTVRSAPNYMGDTTIELYSGLYPYTQASVLLHDNLGPLMSIDLYLLAPPPSLLAAVTSFHSAHILAIQANRSLREAFEALPATTLLDPIPLAWQSTNYSTYFGGNPTCLYGAGATFVQPSFSFEDTCTAQVPSRLVIDRMAAVFAASAMSLTRNPCSLCSVATVAVCSSLEAAVGPVAKTLKSALSAADVAAAATDVQLMEIGIIQMAVTQATTFVILEQPMLGSGDWDFFGYVALYEWAIGIREVVSFQGDVATFNILSEPVDPIPFAANGLEVPVKSCRYFYAVCGITTCLFLCVAAVTVFHTASAAPNDFVQFLRVAGPVWVGRPLLLLRATAALAALCTVPLVFNGDNGIGRFVFGPRSLIDSMILAFEAVWATVVCNDILLVLAPHRARNAAVLCSWLVWLGIVCLDTLAPPQVDTAMERRCVPIFMDVGYKCSRGTVSIGSVARAIELLGVNAVALAVSYVVVGRPAAAPRQ